jgi:hypothetical protein
MNRKIKTIGLILLMTTGQMLYGQTSNQENASNTILPVIISVGVVAAAIAAIANVIVALMNNKRLKGIEKDKKMTEIQKYRYTQLYEIIKHWYDFDTDIDVAEKSEGEIASIRLMHKPLDHKGRWDIVKPLLNPKFTNGIDDMVEKVDELLLKFVKLSKEKEEKEEIVDNARWDYSSCGEKFGKMIRNAINNQLQELLLIDEP